jgi:hypothetical protein
MLLAAVLMIIVALTRLVDLRRSFEPWPSPCA